MEEFLLEEKFNTWKKEDYERLVESVGNLPCKEANLRMQYMSKQVDKIEGRFDDVDMKVDAVIGSQMEDKSRSFRIEGILYVLIPVIVGLLIHLIRNGG